MKDFVMIWNRLSGRRYSSVNTSSINAVESEQMVSITRNAKGLTRKSSVVVNKFFNAAMPMNSPGRQRWPKSIFILMTLGLLGLASGCFVLVCQPYDLLFKLKVVFKEGGEIFELWRKPDVNLYLKVYLFNVTNRDEFMAGKDKKLNFQEVGPYVYKESLEHGNIKFNDNGTVTAIPLHPLTYMPEMSNGTEEDLLILPNIALLSITNVKRDASYFTRLGLNMLIRQTRSEPLVEMTSREFMFGYQSTLVTLGNNFMPSWIKFDKLGLIDRMYDFDGDDMTVFTGERDVRSTGLIDNYNGDMNLPQWTGTCANVMGASDGVKFRSYIEPNETLLFFRKSLCRSIHIIPKGKKVVNGLHSYLYKFMDNEMDNGAYNPENKCFCRQGYCLPPGLIDVTDCYYGFPIALSYPHFYLADPALLEAVDGLHPQQDLHESYFYIQPQSGLPVNIAARFQINMALQNVGHMAKVEKFSNLVLPLLWFEIGMYELPAAMSARFSLYLNVLPVVQDVATYCMLVLGVVFLVWGMVKGLLFHTESSSSSSSSSGSGKWFDIEMQKKRLKFLNDRRASIKNKETDAYYSSLLNPHNQKEDNLLSAEMEDLTSNLKDEVV